MLIKVETQDSNRIAGIITNSGEKMHFIVSFKVSQYELTIASDSLMTNVLYRSRVEEFSLEAIERSINWFIKMDKMLSELNEPVGTLYVVKWANKSKHFSELASAHAFKTVLGANGLKPDEVKIESVVLY